MKELIEVWEPKYSNNTVRVNVNKVRMGENQLIFTKAPSMGDKIYVFDGAKAKTCPIKPNGRGRVYEIPLDWLEEKVFYVR